MVLYFCFGFGMIAWMIAVTQIDEDRLVKKYCPQSSSAGGCEEEELFFLLVDLINFNLFIIKLLFRFYDLSWLA